MEYREVRLDDGLLETLIEMSEEWEREDITFGYVKNSREDIEGNRIFLASENGETAGYLLAHEALMNNHRSIAPDAAAAGSAKGCLRRRKERRRTPGWDCCCSTHPRRITAPYCISILTRWGWISGARRSISA